jgi:hypothetical protein
MLALVPEQEGSRRQSRSFLVVLLLCVMATKGDLAGGLIEMAATGTTGSTLRRRSNA